MITGNNFGLNISVANTDLNVNNDEFGSFNIIENANYNIYTAELTLIKGRWVDFNFAGGENVIINLYIADSKGNQQLYTYSFVVFDYNLYMNGIVLTLVPEYFNNLYINKYTKRHQNKISDIVEYAGSQSGISKFNIESEKTGARDFYQLNQSYFYLLKYICKFTDYLLFIDKTDTLSFTSYEYLNKKTSKTSVTSNNMTKFRLEDNVYGLQSAGGFGGTEYYFDWNSGTMKNYQYVPSQYGIQTSLATNNNVIMQSSPIGDIYWAEEFNFINLQDLVNKKNFFKLFCSFEVVDPSIDITALDKITLAVVQYVNSDINKLLSGDWLVHTIVHHFDVNNATKKYICGRSFFSTTDANFLV